MRLSVFFSFFLFESIIIVSGKVTFNLPSQSSKSSQKSSSSGSDDASSSSSSSAELLFDKKNSDGRFNRLRKDDDLLSLKNKRKKKNKNNNKKKKLVELVRESNGILMGGKQMIGFLYQNGWHTGIKALNGHSEEIEKMTGGIVKEPINSGWWLFAFTKSEVSATKFKFQTNLQVRVSVVDLFCRGDSFGVLDSGKLVAQSSRIRADPECDERMVSPVEALNDGRWSSVVFELDAGAHFIEIKTIDNLNTLDEGKGIAAIKFDHILPTGSKGHRVSRNKVCRGYNGLAVITEPIPSSQCELVCLQLKMQMARADENDLLVKKSLRSCQMKLAWIADSGDGSVKAVGSDGKFIEAKVHEKLPVICRVK